MMDPTILMIRQGYMMRSFLLGAAQLAAWQTRFARGFIAAPVWADTSGPEDEEPAQRADAPKKMPPKTATRARQASAGRRPRRAMRKHGPAAQRIGRLSSHPGPARPH